MFYIVVEIDVLMLLNMICMKFDKFDVVGICLGDRFDRMIDVSGMKNIVMVVFWISVGIISVYVFICMVKCECI